MKKLIAILLSLIVCYNTVGYFIVFKLRQIQIKSEVKRLIKNSVPEEQLVVFSLTPETMHEFSWIHSKEFRYRGEMYDVVRKVAVSADKTELYCIHDVKESGLFSHLDRLVKDAMNHDRKGPGVLKVLSAFFTGLFPPPELFNDYISQCADIQYTVIPDLYSCQPVKVISPPPRS
ncbi:MAG: hypothetical protein AB9834_05385 [Lentimicrobium sp.]